MNIKEEKNMLIMFKHNREIFQANRKHFKALI